MDCDRKGLLFTLVETYRYLQWTLSGVGAGGEGNVSTSVDWRGGGLSTDRREEHTVVTVIVKRMFRYTSGLSFNEPKVLVSSQDTGH